MTRHDSLPTVLLLATALLCFPGCSKNANGKAAAGKPPVAVDITPVSSGTLEEAVEVVGNLTAKSEAGVRTEYTGTVAEVLVTEWVRVKKGTVLARLDTREAEASAHAARAAFLQAQVAANRTERELDRTEKLKAAGLATQQNLDDAKTAHEAARAQLAAAKAQVDVAETRLEKSIIKSPIDGVVSKRGVNVGDLVENMGNPPPMFRVVDNRLLELTVTVPTAKLPDLAVGQQFVFTTDALPGKEFTGKVSYINPTTDEVSRSVKIRTEVPNSGEVLKAGLFVKGRIITRTREGVLLVPRSALQSWDLVARQAGVFVVQDGKAVRKTIETGAVSGDSVEVTRGLAAGEPVVARGAFNLREGDRVAMNQGA